MQSRTFWLSLAFAILAFVGVVRARAPAKLQKLLRDTTLFHTHNCRSHQNKTSPVTGEISHCTKGSSQLRSTLRQPQKTNIMNSHGKRNHSVRFSSGKENDGLARKYCVRFTQTSRTPQHHWRTASIVLKSSKITCNFIRLLFARSDARITNPRRQKLLLYKFSSEELYTSSWR